MLWFGEPWPAPDRRAPVCSDDRLRVPVPVDQPCLFCRVALTEDDQGVWIGHVSPGVARQAEPAHIRCMMINVVGEDMTNDVLPPRKEPT